jgi:hypothetical protein
MVTKPSRHRTLVDTGPQASCRTDYLTTTFKVPTLESVDELMAYAYDLGERVLPGKTAFRPKPGKHFTHVYGHPAGLSLELTPPDAETDSGHQARNAGSAVLSLPGQIWGSLDAAERGVLMTDLRRWPGFYRCTRWDAQITILNPEIGAGEVVDQVEKGRLWPVGFGVGNPYGRKNLHGVYVDIPTQYFGGKESRVRARVYDKAAESRWTVPAVRHELILRREPADQHFRRLADRCQAETPLEPLFVTSEERTVKEALDQHLDYRDTSRWEGRPKPKNWAQSAPRVKWWRDALGNLHDPVAVAYKPALDLDGAVDACINQYGRKATLWAFIKGCKDGTIEEAALEFFLRGVARWKKDDVEMILAELPGVPPEKVRAKFDELVNLAAELTELVAPPWPGEEPTAPRG